MTTTPLSHLRVVECSTFVAGPSCGMALAQLGADVIRVDLPEGGSDYHRWPLSARGSSLYWANLNKGKRSVLIDYRTLEGHELLVALATTPGPGSGLYVDNVVGRHRVTYPQLTAARRDTIAVHVQGFADGRPAVDYTVNAAVGIPDMTGPEGTAGPVNHVLPAWDLLTGATGALGLLSAVTNRDATGEGAHIDLALADVAVSAVGALGWLSEAELPSGPRPPQGNHVFGSFGTDFATSDGQRVMVVALTEGQWDALCDVTATRPVFNALQDSLDIDLRQESSRYQLRETIASILRPWFAARGLDELSISLDKARVLWSPYRTMLQAAAAARRDPSPLVADIEQPHIGSMLASSSPLRWSDSVVPPAPAPALGADTESVLSELLGLSAREIGHLVDTHVTNVAVA